MKKGNMLIAQSGGPSGVSGITVSGGGQSSVTDPAGNFTVLRDRERAHLCANPFPPDAAARLHASGTTAPSAVDAGRCRPARARRIRRRRRRACGPRG